MIQAEAAVAGGPPVERVTATAYRIATERPESDGTFAWDSTTMVLVEIEAGEETGIGWTYGPAAVAGLVGELLAPAIAETGAFEIGAAHEAMRSALRNTGEEGAGGMGLSAVDIALWDLKGRLLGVSVASLLGPAHTEVPVYGSGGFCSYSLAELCEQLGGWIEEGIPRVKMKIGRDPLADPARVEAAREAIGGRAELYVDANGALSVKQALRFAERYAELGVSWFEEPVRSQNLDGLRLLRDHGPAGLDIAAGEYAATPAAFRALADVVDCLQADATRCGGVTGLLAAASVARAHELELSGHCAPTVHAHALAAVPNLRHLEWFHDHVRIERILFDGFREPKNGAVTTDPDRPGLGVEFRRADAERYGV